MKHIGYDATVEAVTDVRRDVLAHYADELSMLVQCAGRPIDAVLVALVVEVALLRRRVENLERERDNMRPL